MAAPVSAIGSGRQRALLSEAQAAAASLRALPLDAPASEVHVALHSFAALLRRLRMSAELLMAPEQAAIWRQRGAWLHDELTVLAAERLQSDEPAQFWGNLVGLLYVGAAAADAEAAEKEAAQGALETERRRAAELAQRLESAAAAAAAASKSEQSSISAAGGAGGGEELLQAESKLLVAQQELQRRAADASEQSRRMQALLSERDDWRRQYEAVRERHLRESGGAERQSQVIVQLMERSEEAAQQARELADESDKLQVHNKTLSVNLAQHAGVLEKLIALNTELMDQLNARTTQKLHPPPPLLPTPLATRPVSADGLSGRGAAAGPPLPLSFTPAQPPSPGLFPGHDAQGAAALARVFAPSTAGGAGTGADSLGAAFQSFLTNLPPAGALELAEPMTPPSLRLPAPRLITSSARGVPAGGAASAAAASDPPRLGLFGFLGYIAGSDKAREARAAEFGTSAASHRPPDSIQRQLDAIL